MGQRRSPGVEHGSQADTGAEMSGVGGDGDQGLGGGLEQDAVDHRLVLVGDVGDRSGQGEDDMIVFHRQQLGLARGEPVLCRRSLAFWAMPITT